MRHGYHRRRNLDYRDVSPHTGSEESSAARAWREQLATAEGFSQGSLGGGELQTYRYLGPAGRGRHRVESPKDQTKEIIITSAPGIEGFVPGQWVLTGQTQAGPTIIAHPPGAETGLSRQPRTTRSGAVDNVEVISANPSTIEPGQTLAAVAVAGIGFLASPLDTFTPVVPDISTPSDPWATDTLLTLGTPVWVSAEQVNIDVTASSATPVGHLIRFRVRRT